MENNSLDENQVDLLRRNLELNEKILQNTLEIRKFIKWQHFWSMVRLVVLVVPIILGFLYLPNFIESYLNKLTL